MIRKLFVTCVLVLASATIAAAQALATLVADSVQVDPSGRLTASGNVIVYYQGTELRAERVVYDRRSDTLEIDGSVVITDENGNVISGDGVSTGGNLKDGVLRSARLVLDQELQLAAAEISRSEERYTTLRRVVASTCEVCSDNPTPLWEIRATRVIHDTQERQLYFDNAQFRLAGIPLLYAPRLRLPDPSLDRASGFLFPELRTSSLLGTGLELPYFIAIGDHANAVVTPYVSSSTATLNFELQQEIRNGRLTFEGALTDDDIEGQRGYYWFCRDRRRLCHG